MSATAKLRKQEVHGRSIIKGKKLSNLNIHFVVSIYSLVFIKSVERRLAAFWLGSSLFQALTYSGPRNLETANMTLFECLSLRRYPHTI